MSEHPTKHSSDLLNIPGRSHTIAKLLVDQKEELQPQKNEIPQPTQKPNMFKVDPPSDILSRVQAFLPQLQSANNQLKSKNPEALDIEQVDEEKGQYIEMNLGLGVFEEKRNIDTSDSEHESSDNEGIIVPPASKTKHTKKPTIQMLPSHSSTTSDEE